MQTKIITCHDVYNHGASLQTYALQTYLMCLGHNVEIIDYKPGYLSNHFNLWSVSNESYNKPLVKQLYLLAKLPSRLKALRRKKKFDCFTSGFLRLTPHRYRSYEELKSNPPQADAFIAGSDQIWNTLFQNGRDPAFYLDFVSGKAKRIAYAASFATQDIVKEYRSFVSTMLRAFDSISLRESTSIPLLASLGRDDGVAVCDPVFLLSQAQWSQLASYRLNLKRPYLLVYDTEKSETVKQIACRIAKDRKLHIYNISPFPLSYATKDYWISSPFDFVCLIRDSEYVVSNSFHATAFSLIFHREFCVVNRTESINERMHSILSQYGLQNRLFSGESSLDVDPIDYERVQSIIDYDIVRSKQFLQTALG